MILPCYGANATPMPGRQDLPARVGGGRARNARPAYPAHTPLWDSRKIGFCTAASPPEPMPNDTKTPPEGAHLTNFIRQHVERDLAEGKYAQRRWAGKPGTASVHANAPLDPAKIRTRFPPEPNGYLHIRHAQSICLNFCLPDEYGGVRR